MIKNIEFSLSIAVYHATLVQHMNILSLDIYAALIFHLNFAQVIYFSFSFFFAERFLFCLETLSLFWICLNLLREKKTQNKKKAREQEKWMVKMLTWKTVTVAHKMLLKCFRSHSQCGCLLIISGQVHSLSCPLISSVNLQNLPPNRYMPSMLFTTVFSLYSYIYCIYGLL